MARIRLDKVVDLRERAEDQAMIDLATAQRDLQEAEARLLEAEEASRLDGRVAGDASLWALEEAAHRRTLQIVRQARGEVQVATRKREVATQGYVSAHQDAEAVRRVAERKRAEEKAERERRERRAADEIATLRFNRK